MLSIIWRYLAAQPEQPIQESPICLVPQDCPLSAKPLSLEQLMTCLDVFRDGGLLTQQRMHKYITITLTPGREKADLSKSATMQRLLSAAAVKES